MSDGFLRLVNDEIEVLLTPVGASIRSLFVKDAEGNFRDVVLGYETEEGYRSNRPSLGAVIGRYAGRIGGARFLLEGREYRLDMNEGKNCLHGGFSRYSTRTFRVLSATEEEVVFELTSPDGDQGFPGNARVQVTYSLEEGARLSVRYFAETDASTFFNLTNHSYFNLNGHDAGRIDGHRLTLAADSCLVLDGEGIPTGEIRGVAGTELDLRGETPLTGSFDHCFVLRKDDGPCASLFSPESGIRMEVFTDRPALVLYTSGHLDEPNGKHGVAYGERHAVCLETEGYSDAPNHPAFPAEISTPEKPFSSETVFCFGLGSPGLFRP